MNCAKVKGSGDEIDISNLRDQESEWTISYAQPQEVALRIKKFNDLLGQD